MSGMGIYDTSDYHYKVVLLRRENERLCATLIDARKALVEAEELCQEVDAEGAIRSIDEALAPREQSQTMNLTWEQVRGDWRILPVDFWRLWREALAPKGEG